MRIGLTTPWRVVILAVLWLPTSAFASVLSEAAARLQPGESIRIQTDLPGSLLAPDNANFLMWGSSGGWDPVRNQLKFVGKRDGPNPFRFLIYDEADDRWELGPSPLPEDSFGHAYDHNAMDPVTGTAYFRRYNSDRIYSYDGNSWTRETDMPARGRIAAAITWWNGKGLIFSDSRDIRILEQGSWRDIADSPHDFVYHNVSEYSAEADIMIFGGGNGGRNMYKLTRNEQISAIATPPFNLGSSSSQAVLSADPASKLFVGYEKKTRNWTVYDPDTNQWSDLPQSSGDGSSPQQGAPNLSTGHNAVIGVPIPAYGVIMYVQYLGSSNAGVWLFKANQVVQPESPVLHPE